MKGKCRLVSRRTGLRIQGLFVTHHERLVEITKSLTSEAGLFVHRMGCYPALSAPLSQNGFPKVGDTIDVTFSYSQSPLPYPK